MSVLNASLNQLAVRRCSVGRELYYLRQDQLEILKQLGAPRVVTCG
jgi:hypothetical protein